MQINGKKNMKFTVMSDIRAALLSDPAIMSHVAGRIYPVVAPENSPTGPFILYTRDGYSTAATKSGMYLQKCSVYISCVSADYDDANLLAEEVFLRLDGFADYENPETGVRISRITMTDSTEDFAADRFIVTLKFDIE